MLSIVKLLALLILIPVLLCAQTNSQYVNPFVGTEKSDVVTKWGSEGGTYPGAVAPSGYIQLTPETSIEAPRGYYYHDTAIYFFSCLNHKSGFPAGSAGQLLVMPVDAPANFKWHAYKRSFSHRNENATPGYYSVIFNDNDTKAEATVSARAGMFRFTFPSKVVPYIFIGGAGEIVEVSGKKMQGSKHRSVFEFSKNYNKVYATDSGYIYSFTPSTAGVTIITLAVSASPAGTASAQKNIDKDVKQTSFELLKKRTAAEWEKLLSVIEINDSSRECKTIFYTALYHSLLVPWIISDVAGNYMGRDGKVYKTIGKNEYGGFSPWDTFRSLHPLITFLYPEKQKDMVLSLLDIYKQTGNLPVETMTGNHAATIIVDSYLKGITVDSALAYKAIKSNILTGPFRRKDMSTYIKENYVPSTLPESVTRTVEYAYNEWSAGQYAQKVMHNSSDFTYFNNKGFNYRQLFNKETLFLLPRSGDEFKNEPGTSGYKEGDKWSYSYFTPHQPRDLVNLLGGNDYFAERLDSALTNDKIIFDNESVFHVPYFFNYAAHHWLTQKWVSHILRDRYHASPGGLPGNDDLGSLSSWYVFSALGIYPFCPGDPVYTVGSPVFHSVKIKLTNGKKMIINKKGAGVYINTVTLNGTVLDQPIVSHAAAASGGVLNFGMSRVPVKNIFKPHDTNEAIPVKPLFTLSDFTISTLQTEPGDIVWIYFSLRNDGAQGTQVISLNVNDKIYSRKYCFAEPNTTRRDSIALRLYLFGKTVININNLAYYTIEVVNTPGNLNAAPEITNLVINPLVKSGDELQVFYSVQNTGGSSQVFIIPLNINNVMVKADSIKLAPGELKEVITRVKTGKGGFQKISIYAATAYCKVYTSVKESILLNLSLQNREKHIIKDVSGFANDAMLTPTCDVSDSLPLFGDSCFAELRPSLSLDKMGEQITMMAWIYTTGGDRKKVDIISKGDHHVLQVSGNRMIKFFAGGWARGECDARLPQDWKNKWHHVAGTCNGRELKIYVDGVLQTTTLLNSKAALSSAGQWNIGSNEEFPNERVFNGYIDHVKIFAEALTEQEIKEVMVDE
jgi:putative alpha-1,2-mannosidase